MMRFFSRAMGRKVFVPEAPRDNSLARRSSLPASLQPFAPAEWMTPSAPCRFTPNEPPEELVILPNGRLWQANLVAAEQILILRTRLLQLMQPRKLRSVLITSAIDGEGKTLISANLGFAMSRIEGMKVLLVDADLRKASLGNLLQMHPREGLSTYLQNGRKLSEVRSQLCSDLAVVATPCVCDQAVELLSGERIRSFMGEAAAEHNLVIIDAPPVLALADAQILASVVDGVILVARAGRTPYDLTQKAVELLKPKLLGVVVNAVRRMPHNRYYYGNYRHYSMFPDTKRSHG